MPKAYLFADAVVTIRRDPGEPVYPLRLWTASVSKQSVFSAETDCRISDTDIVSFFFSSIGPSSVSGSSFHLFIFRIALSFIDGIKIYFPLVSE